MSPFFEKYFGAGSVTKKILFGLLGVVVIGVVAVALMPAPSAQGGLKGHTVEMSRNGSIRIVFSQYMNRRSVEEAFRITPPLAGAFSWQGNQLTYTPSSVLEKDATYEVVIDATARSLFLKHLNETFRQTFKIVDYPEVSVFAPVDKTVVAQDQILTVLLDRPMRSLKGDVRVPTSILTINPPVNGKYQWLGTSGFEFTPENGWPAATLFTVTVPKGTKVADGGSLIEDVTWTFSTPAVAVSLASVAEHQKPYEPIKLEFNYPVKPEDVARELVILQDQIKLNNDQFTFGVDKDNANIITIKKNGDYELGKTYVFKLPKDSKVGLGSLGLVNDWEKTIKMDEKGFRQVFLLPQNGQKKEVNQNFVACFNNPVDPTTFEKGIRIEPAIEDFQVYSNGYYAPDECPSPEGALSISGRWKASTDYTITFGDQLTDIYGQKLASKLEVRFATNPYLPSFQLSSYSLYGVLASHLPRVYQARTLNWKTPITATLHSAPFSDVARGVHTTTLEGEKIYDTTEALNKYKILDVDLDAIANKKLDNGFYQLSFRGIDPDYNNQPRHLIITDTALTVKRDRTGKVLIWATDLKTGAVVPRMNVEIWTPTANYDRTNLKKLGQGTTNEQGVAMIQLDESTISNGLLIKATSDKRLGYVETEWSDGISPWNYGLDRTYDRTSKFHIGYVYTERRIYRSDQQVFFKGVVRLDDDARLSLPEAREVKVTIEDPSGAQVWSKNLPLSGFGTFNGEFQAEPTMKLGAYRLYATVQSGKEELKPIETMFDIREYRRPDFKVEVTPPAGTAYAGQKIQIPIQAEYYQGIPLKNAKVNYSITRTKLFFQPMQGRWWNDWYNFSLEENADCYWYCPANGGFEPVQSGEGVLDDKGNLTIELPANLTDYSSSATYVADVTVTDVNQRQVSSRVEFPVHKGEFYIGIRPDYSGGWNAPKADFDLASIQINGSPKSNVAATVKFLKRVWSNVKKVGPDGNPMWEWQKTDTLVETKTVTTNGEGKARVSFAPNADGEYLAIVEARDGRGQLVSASAYRYVYRGSGGTLPISDDHQMKIIQNKASYSVGDTASLAIQTPYEATKALVTIERNSIREYRVIDLGSNKRTVDIYIKDTDTPNVYVSVLAVKGGGETGIPEFRLGYANLQVDTMKKILHMTVTPDKTTYRPGETVSLVVETKNSEGAAVAAEVSIAVVDERVIALLGAIDKDILGKFWFPRLLGVDTAQTLTMLVKKVFFATEGGGGGKGDAGAVPAVRGNFKDTAYWNATVVTGADGKARVSFSLPDNLTSWNVLAIGETKDTTVGQAEAKIITRRELMVEPLLPRMLRHSDTATLGATIINGTDKGFDVQVNMQGEGVAVEGGMRTVRVEPQSRAVVSWMVRVPSTGTQAKFTVSAKGGGHEDALQATLPVLDFSVSETVSASGILEKNATETLEIPENILPNVGQVDVSVQPNIGNGLQNGLDYLVFYPYGCSEQKTSGLLANLMYEELVKLRVTNADPVRVEKAKKNVQDTIKILVSSQRPEGGWGFWPEYERTYPWLTGYVFWGLTQAQKAGFEVDANTLDRAAEYLRQSLEKAGEEGRMVWTDSQKAQVLFMLAERNPENLAGQAATLYERRAQLPVFAKLFLAMAYNHLEQDRTSARGAELLKDVKNKVIYLNPSTVYVKEEPGYEDLLSSDLRTSSLYLQALLRMDPKNEDIERVLRYIIENRSEGYWHTTHDTAMTLLGLVEYARLHPVDTSKSVVSLYLDNQLKETLKFDQGDVSGAALKTFPLPELATQGSTHQLGLEKDSPTRYFYDINMKVYRDIQEIEPFDQGMTIVADAYALSDAKNEHPLTEVKQGENVRIHMKLLVPKRRRYVGMEYHLPAGLEGVDFKLKTSPQQIAGEEKQCYPDWQGKQRCLSDADRVWWWENVWTHTEFRDDRVFLFAENLEPGVYEYDFIAQAATPGEYRVPPARAYEFYNPNANGHNEGKVFKVVAK